MPIIPVHIWGAADKGPDLKPEDVISDEQAAQNLLAVLKAVKSTAASTLRK